MTSNRQIYISCVESKRESYAVTFSAMMLSAIALMASRPAEIDPRGRCLKLIGEQCSDRFDIQDHGVLTASLVEHVDESFNVRCHHMVASVNYTLAGVWLGPNIDCKTRTGGHGQAPLCCTGTSTSKQRYPECSGCIPARGPIYCVNRKMNASQRADEHRRFGGRSRRGRARIPHPALDAESWREIRQVDRLNRRHRRCCSGKMMMMMMMGEWIRLRCGNLALYSPPPQLHVMQHSFCLSMLVLLERKRDPRDGKIHNMPPPVSGKYPSKSGRFHSQKEITR